MSLRENWREAGNLPLDAKYKFISTLLIVASEFTLIFAVLFLSTLYLQETTAALSSIVFQLFLYLVYAIIGLIAWLWVRGIDQDNKGAWSGTSWGQKKLLPQYLAIAFIGFVVLVVSANFLTGVLKLAVSPGSLSAAASLAKGADPSQIVFRVLFVTAVFVILETILRNVVTSSLAQDRRGTTKAILLMTVMFLTWHVPTLLVQSGDAYQAYKTSIPAATGLPGCAADQYYSADFGECIQIPPNPDAQGYAMTFGVLLLMIFNLSVVAAALSIAFRAWIIGLMIHLMWNIYSVVFLSMAASPVLLLLSGFLAAVPILLWYTQSEGVKD